MSLNNYKQRALECMRLAKLSSKPEDWGHFLEMAETWDKLAALQEYSQQSDQWACSSGSPWLNTQADLRESTRPAPLAARSAHELCAEDGTFAPNHTVPAIYVPDAHNKFIGCLKI
jgi:hypothetical protein